MVRRATHSPWQSLATWHLYLSMVLKISIVRDHLGSLRCWCADIDSWWCHATFPYKQAFAGTVRVKPQPAWVYAKHEAVTLFNKSHCHANDTWRKRKSLVLLLWANKMMERPMISRRCSELQPVWELRPSLSLLSHFQIMHIWLARIRRYFSGCSARWRQQRSRWK